MKIWLNFIMKDEQRVLMRMLTSVLPIIDGIICVDTGSTDNSKDIVKQFCADNNIECEIYDHPFVNFSDARNFALDKLRSKSGFAFWIDCDEKMILSDNFNKETLISQLSQVDSGLVMVKYSGSEYARRLFFKCDMKCHWQGAVHEYLSYDQPVKEAALTDMSIYVYSDGNSWNEEDIRTKYLKHAQILLEEVRKTNDPRDVFYLAQSLKDGGSTEASISWYRQRAERTDGFFEERYYAQFTIGMLSQSLDKPSMDIVWEYMKSHELDTLRGEGILNLIIELQHRKMWNSSYIFSKYAVEKYHEKNPYPKRHLFINAYTYEKGILEAHKLNCQMLNVPMDVVIHNKVIAQKEYDFKITFAYINHDKSVCEKYFYPSFNNMMKFNNGRHLIKSLSESSANGNPAKLYNLMLKKCETDYIIFTHADVTFSRDFCERIFDTINNNPDFGALGIVGVDHGRNYHWATNNKPFTVETLDCCCILINKKHELFFDENMFDDFHLYVEDMCMQIRKKGLQCYTMLVNASEQSPEIGYNMLTDKYNYFNHHSYTLNQRGCAWGRYPEYKEKLNKKWGMEVQTT